MNLESPHGTNLSPPAPPPNEHPCAHCAGVTDCLIGSLPAAMRQPLGAVLTEQRFTKGQVLAQQGARMQTLRIVKTGSVLLHGQGWDGVSHPVALAGRGTAAGLLGLCHQDNAIGVVAISDGRFCEIDHEHLRIGTAVAPVWQDAVMAAVARSYERLTDWAQVARLSNVADRLAAALLLLTKEQQSRLVRLPDHASLAALLGMSRESVVRALANLQKTQCVVRRDASHYEVLVDAVKQRLQ